MSDNVLKECSNDRCNKRRRNRRQRERERNRRRRQRKRNQRRRERERNQRRRQRQRNQRRRQRERNRRRRQHNQRQRNRRRRNRRQRNRRRRNQRRCNRCHNTLTEFCNSVYRLCEATSNVECSHRENTEETAYAVALGPQEVREPAIDENATSIENQNGESNEQRYPPVAEMPQEIEQQMAELRLGRRTLFGNIDGEISAYEIIEYFLVCSPSERARRYQNLVRYCLDLMRYSARRRPGNDVLSVTLLGTPSQNLNGRNDASDQNNNSASNNINSNAGTSNSNDSASNGNRADNHCNDSN